MIYVYGNCRLQAIKIPPNFKKRSRRAVRVWRNSPPKHRFLYLVGYRFCVSCSWLIATERANVKTDGMRSNTLMPQENSNSFTVGNWKRQIKRRKGNGMTSHWGKKKSWYSKILMMRLFPVVERWQFWNWLKSTFYRKQHVFFRPCQMLLSYKKNPVTIYCSIS